MPDTDRRIQLVTGALKTLLDSDEYVRHAPRDCSCYAHTAARNALQQEINPMICKTCGNGPDMDSERYAAHMLNYHGIATAPCGCTYNAPRCDAGTRLFVAAFHERRATNRTIALMAKGARDAFEAAINTEDRWMAHYRNDNTIPASNIVTEFNEYMGNEDA